LPLQRALESEKVDVAEVILSHGANIQRVWEQILDGYLSLVLSESASDVDLEALRLCLKAKGCVPSKDNRIQTLFRHMATRLEISTTKLIYDNGYQPSGEDLRYIGGVLDKNERFYREDAQVNEEQVRWFKLWLFEVVNYPRSLKSSSAMVVKKLLSKNAIYGARKLNLANLIE
jgi:predicted amino acid-binding ACT domain protein